jgi:hypothetical protein
MRLLKRDRPERMGYCDRCESFCDTSCRAEALRDANLQSLLRNGLRIA